MLAHCKPHRSALLALLVQSCLRMVRHVRIWPHSFTSVIQVTAACYDRRFPLLPLGSCAFPCALFNLVLCLRLTMYEFPRNPLYAIPRYSRAVDA